MCFAGYETKQVRIQDDLTISIDSKGYFEFFKAHRTTKEDYGSNQNASKLCSASENEVYEKCGKKCMLSCRFDSSTLKITATKDECEKTDCIEGCFCKDGFVRYEDKCIPVSECPSTYKSVRSNKAIDVATESSSPLVKHFGLFMRPGGCGPSGCGGFTNCGPSGCGGGSTSCGPNGCGIHIHNHNEAITGGGGKQFD